MTYKKLLVFIIAFLILLIVLFRFSKQDSYRKMKVMIGGKEFVLEVADTDSLRGRGLSGRKSLQKYSGMIFLFDQKAHHSFWMKEMFIPLDFIWINETKITDLSKDVQPPPNLYTKDLPLIIPKEPVNRVIEVNTGIIDELKLKIGDEITFLNKYE